jgi:RNA polymerase sporulation-specific sigma factor
MALGVLLIGAAALVNSFLLAAYYLNNNSFPQPLNEAEEQAYLKAMDAGDAKAKDILIERNLRLVAHIVKKFEGRSEDRDDLISIGTIGLIKAIHTFKEHKGVKLATYAARCIENEILMYYRAGRKSKGEVSLYDPIGTDKEGNPIILLEVLGTDPDIVLEEVQNRIEFQQLLEQVNLLEDRERQVINWRFGLEDGCRKTQREVAQILQISRSYVSRIEKRAVAKLIKALKLLE